MATVCGLTTLTPSAVTVPIAEWTTRRRAAWNGAATFCAPYQLWSERYGLSGRADIIEIHPDDTVIPVEHKAGVPHGRTADLQLCAQAICLEDMLQIPVPEGYVWYGGTRRRNRVVFDNRLRTETLNAVAEIRAQLISGELPSAPNDARCSECQLREHCLPEVVSAPTVIASYIRRAVWGQ